MITFPERLAEQPPLLTVLLEPSHAPATPPSKPDAVDETQPVTEQAPTATEFPENIEELLVVPEPSVDWYAAIPAAIDDVRVAPEEVAVFNRALAEKRRAAAQQFAPIPRHEPVPVWENVEKDMTGRSILRHGDCQRVINDPNVGSREAFETFGQYIVTCAHYKKPPQKLAWVDEVNARRAGLSRYGHPPAE
ncbi:MAG: hypothetical protein K0U72_13850 [Gammaproteobacteria bacterium]|nr:hypothetical protein [Gammaproteobacteria bacterium]